VTWSSAGFLALCNNQQTRLPLQSPAAVPGSASSRSRRSWPQRPSGSGRHTLASSASLAASSEMFFRAARPTMPTSVPSPAGLQLSIHLSRDRRSDMRTAGKSKQGSRCRVWNLFRSDSARHARLTSCPIGTKRRFCSSRTRHVATRHSPHESYFPRAPRRQLEVRFAPVLGFSLPPSRHGTGFGSRCRRALHYPWLELRGPKVDRISLNVYEVSPSKNDCGTSYRCGAASCQKRCSG